ncbi:PoNe immunity protein domain-containing protein [Stenotrophomonas sp. G4]|uniref:PoNe immunity protein domain-containing protein n=1 Tax=Stenotrophomonas sp. G4 TaxID=2303750 RepID=UPI000E3C8F9E|nr:PoNe immunity protein domain-containing protein [Stenotrophomonas sp. G4]
MQLESPDWKKWMARRVSEDGFEHRREPNQRYGTYLAQFKDTVSGIAMVTLDLPKHAAKARKSGLMMSTQQRLWDTLDFMSLQYSAGAPIDQLAEIWPYAMQWAEEYGSFDKAYDDSPENTSGERIPHAPLVSESYWIVALRMVCFGILTGNANDLPRVMAFLDYVNAELGIHDGLLERLVAPWAPGRPIPDTATRHLPYRKLFKVFDATPDKRPALMAPYLDEWYHASRREPYIDQHGEGDISFYGYWSWEAAATTIVLGIDDSSYRDMAFYPKDLADYARQATSATADETRISRVAAGELCPQDGWWYTPAQGSRRYFKQGDVFPTINSDWGDTFWIWAQDQTPPTMG